MMQAIILVLAYALMLAGPLLQGLAGNSDPYAYVFAPVMLAGAIPLIAGQNIRPNPRILALAVLVCGAASMGLWYLGTRLGPVAVPGFAPVGCAVLGAVLTACTNLLRPRA